MGERRGRPSADNVENFPEVPSGMTAAIVAEKAGFGNAEIIEYFGAA
jgi:hypothetical protein